MIRYRVGYKNLTVNIDQRRYVIWRIPYGKVLKKKVNLTMRPGVYTSSQNKCVLIQNRIWFTIVMFWENANYY